MAKKSSGKAPDNLTTARKVLDPIWRKALLKGKCRGPRKKDQINPFGAKNIILGEVGGIVSVSQLPDGTLVVREFCECLGGTPLGNGIRRKLKSAGLALKD